MARSPRPVDTGGSDPRGTPRRCGMRERCKSRRGPPPRRARLVRRPPRPPRPPRARGPSASAPLRARRPPDERPSGTHPQRRRERGPRRLAAARARPPRRRAAAVARGGRRRECASADPVPLECVQVRDDAQTRAVGHADRAVLVDLERDGKEPVAPLGRPRGRIERHLEVRARRARESGVHVGEKAVSVRPGVGAPPAPGFLARPPRRDARLPSLRRARRRSGRRRRRRA